MSDCTIDEFKSDLIFVEICLSVKRYIVTFLLCRISGESGITRYILKVTCDYTSVYLYVRLKICHALT